MRFVVTTLSNLKPIIRRSFIKTGLICLANQYTKSIRKTPIG